jgi:hypothetical protein
MIFAPRWARASAFSVWWAVIVVIGLVMGLAF